MDAPSNAPSTTPSLETKFVQIMKDWDKEMMKPTSVSDFVSTYEGRGHGGLFFATNVADLLKGRSLGSCKIAASAFVALLKNQNPMSYPIHAKELTDALKKNEVARVRELWETMCNCSRKSVY